MNGREWDSRDFAVGDRVVFYNTTQTRSFQLQVVQRTVYAFGNCTEVELHLLPGQTLDQWETWFSRGDTTPRTS